MLKQISVLSLLCSFSIIGTASADIPSAIISGRVINCNNPYIHIARPINGTVFHGFSDRYSIAESGEFNIKLDIETKGFVKVEYHPSAYKSISFYLYMQPGDSCNIDLNPAAESNSYKITGSNNEGQSLYNLRRKQMNLGDVRFGKSFYYSDSLSAIELKDSITHIMDHELGYYEDLYKSNKIDTIFLTGITNDIQYYYACFLVEIVQNIYFGTNLPEDHPNHRSEFPEDYAELYNTVFDSISAVEEIATMSTWYHFPGGYGWDYTWYNGYYQLQRNGEFDEDKMNENLWRYIFNQYKSCLSGKNLEYSLATYLWTSTIDRYDIEFVELFEEYRSLFPKSRYQIYLFRQEERLRKFHEIANELEDTNTNPDRFVEIPSFKLEKNYLDGIHFLDSMKTIVSLKDAVATFKGKVVYIDIWATWCGPCIQEFMFEPDLKQFLRNYDVEMLYISVDKDAYHKKWKDFIKVYNLTGHHIRASKQLANNISQITGTSAIPWYFIVDKEGNLVERQAYRPGMQDKLFDQILKYCEEK